MLQELHITNVALIEKASLEFSPGLNVLTGETGAGKTVVIGAMGLILGGRADTSLIRTGCRQAEVEAIFTIPDDARLPLEDLADFMDDRELIVRRVVSLDGKNRSTVNGRSVTASMLANIGNVLIDVHGQHEHQSLFKTQSHVDFLDAYGGPELLESRSVYIELHRELERRRRELERLKKNERELLGRKDLLRYQINEIESAQLQPDEDIELQRERDILRNAEKIFTGLSQAQAALAGDELSSGAIDLLGAAAQALRSIAGYDDKLANLAERIDRVIIDADDCQAELRSFETGLEFPPGRLEEIESRLAFISLLKRKYGSAVADILEYQKNAQDELTLCDTSEDRLLQLAKENQELALTLGEHALKLSEARRQAAKRFEKAVIGQLGDLHMPNASFAVSFNREQDDNGLPVNGEHIRMQSTGIDRIEFLVAANKGEPLKPLAKIASGGEISRIMLALKTILADVDRVPTLIFDEVDAGIGGKTATSVGRKMAVVARNHQVLAVTHLPQIASFADRHFSVEKRELGERTVTTIQQLEDDRRLSEMARLLSGNMESEISLKHAEELLTEASKVKLGTD